MAEISSKFLPVAHLIRAERVNGLIAPWAKQCERCDRQCETSDQTGLALCSYGVNFLRFSKDVLLFGFLVHDGKSTSAKRKAANQNHESVINSTLLERIIGVLSSEAEAFQEARKQALEEYKTSSAHSAALLDLLRPEIKKSMAFLHDYKQFVTQVKTNINVVLQSRFPGEDIDLQLAKATKSEAAIYWAAVMMEDKLNSALILTQPERLAEGTRTRFRLHGFILKHIRIYQAAFDDKEIKVVQEGRSTGEIIGSQTFGVIPQALLDNALKYSSRGCQVTVAFHEDEENIDFSVVSFGPKIEPHELTSIFHIFSRGSAGIAHQEEGSGIGLYLAQMVAFDLGTEIKVAQEAQRTKCGHRTTFSVRFARER